MMRNSYTLIPDFDWDGSTSVHRLKCISIMYVDLQIYLMCILRMVMKNKKSTSLILDNIMTEVDATIVAYSRQMN